MAAVCMCLNGTHMIELQWCVCMYVCMQAIKYMARHIKHGDQTCERDLCVLFSGIHKKIICGCK